MGMQASLEASGLGVWLTLTEIVAFHLNEIRQYQHFWRQAETVQLTFLFTSLKHSHRQMDCRFFSVSSNSLTQHMLSVRFNTLAWVKVDSDVQYCCVSFEPEV